ncbi:hypothetical protein Tco_0780534 [Tanacetum coccineum]
MAENNENADEVVRNNDLNFNVNNNAKSITNNDLPQLLDLRVSLCYSCHEDPSEIRGTKIADVRLKFNAFKALEDEKMLKLTPDTNSC